MSTGLEIDGLKMIPLKDVAKDFSYTKDYVARLAREKKIVATQIGRQWYIDPLSLKNFVVVAEMDSLVRRRHLSESRKREQLIKVAASNLRLIKEKKTSSRSRRIATIAAVLVAGFFVNVGITTNLQNLTLKNKVIESDFSTKDFAVAEPMPTALFSTVSGNDYFIESEVNSIDENNSGVLLLPKGSVVEEYKSEQVAGLFSDEVEVYFSDDKSSGVILYLDNNGVLQKRDFISIPVDVALSANSLIK